MHTVFTQDDNDDRMTAFSFMTNSGTKVYLVPRSNRPFKIRSKITDDPQYVFKIGPVMETISISVSTWQCDDEGQYELM